MERSFYFSMLQYWRSIADLTDYSEALRPSAIGQDMAKIELLKQPLEGLLDAIAKTKQLHDNDENTTATGITDIINMLNESAITSDDSAKTKNIPEIAKLELDYTSFQESPYIKEWASKNSRALYNVSVQSNVDLLHKSVLIALVGAFEVLLADIFHIYFTLHPKSLSTDKTFSIKELLEYASIDEIIEKAISDKIDELLRKSIEEKNEFFEKYLKINIKKLIICWDDFSEILQRRHIFVHNAGKVSKQYLSKVSPSWIKKQNESIELGKTLIISNQYLSNAMSTFLTLGLKLCYLCWLKLQPEETEKCNDFFIGIVYDLLLEKNWNVAYELCSLAINENNCCQANLLVYTINRWLCIKRLDRWAEIKSDIERFDHNACNIRYSLCVHALKEDKENFFKTLPLAIATGVTKHELENWPILEEMRKCPQFFEFISKMF